MFYRFLPANFTIKETHHERFGFVDFVLFPSCSVAIITKLLYVIARSVLCDEAIPSSIVKSLVTAEKSMLAKEHFHLNYLCCSQDLDPVPMCGIFVAPGWENYCRIAGMIWSSLLSKSQAVYLDTAFLTHIQQSEFQSQV
jgi:hypothetical protein